MDYYYVAAQSENVSNIQQVPMGYTEYHPTGNQEQPLRPVTYQQAATSVLPTYPVIISHQILQQASPPESPRSLCSSSDESLQKPNSAMSKKKRTRTAFNNFQVMELEREYRQSMYMQRNRRQEVAQRLSLDEKHIKIWFQNRRMRYKREGKLSQKLKTQDSVESENIQSNESNDHKNIVKRFMSYSQDPLAQQSAGASIELHQPQLQQNLLPPSPPPTESAELTEILDLLADQSTTAIPTASQSSEFFTHRNFTEILDYLKEPLTSSSKLAPAIDQSDEILEYLTSSFAPTMPLKEDSELSEILNYLEETNPTSKQMKSPSHSPLVDEASLKKIRNELEISAEAWRKRSMTETTIPTSILVPEHRAQRTETIILTFN